MIMDKRDQGTVGPQLRLPKYARIGLVATVVAVILSAVLAVRINTRASNDAIFKLLALKPTPVDTPSPHMPPQTPATRVRIMLGEKQDLQVATGVDSFILVSPETATVENKNRFTLTITGTKVGETILLITYGQHRYTYVVEVVGKPSGYARQFTGETVRKPSATTGSFTTLYSQGFDGSPSILRQTLSYRRKLSNDRTLRVSGDMSKLFGSGDRDLALAQVREFAFNRLSVGVETPTKTIDLVDSEINISPLTLNNYTMRGFHMTRASKFATDRAVSAKGLEIFAGMARPLVSFFDNTSGKIAGAMVPFIDHKTFQVRAGLLAVSPEKNNRTVSGGAIFQLDATFSLKKEISADGELSYSRGDLSWRGRVDLTFLKYGASAEVTRFARSSPLISIGAQPGGRKSEAVSFYWRPDPRFSAAAGFTRTDVRRQTNSQLGDYGRSRLFFSANYSLKKSARINVRYTDQSIETAFPGSVSKFEINTRTFMVGNTYKFNQNWSNLIEARLIFSREARADAGLERGFSINEQLRYSWRGASATGFVNFTHKTPSLTSLIVRDPRLLPVVLQTAFALDPAGFLRTYRDRLQFLLGGIDLPQTRSFDAGVRFQKTFSLLTVMGETRYNAGEIYAANQRSVYTAASVGVRLDNANSMRVNAWRAFGGGQSGVTVSYTHQFGSSGDGFQFSKLLNFSRGTVRGRVFYDLNGNGLFDPAEPGVAGMKMDIDGNKSVITDKDGLYTLPASEGSHTIALRSDELGVRLLASTPTEQRIALDGRQRLDLNFGVSDFGAVSGRVFNDIGPYAQNAPGLAGVKITLRSADTGFGSFALERTTGPSGMYDFRGLRPGKYLIEIDPATVPANFRIPAITGSSVVVESLHSSVYDVPIAAQRAIAGTVFIDRNGDGRYTNGIDEPVEGVTVAVEDTTSVSGADGAYLLRDLPAGKARLLVRWPDGLESASTEVELEPGPAIQRSVDVPVPQR